MREISRSTQYERRDTLTWYAAGLHNFRLRMRKKNKYSLRNLFGINSIV
ncbi:MAG: hypothetical protein EAZ92_02235 [Candidatus Kapaibacterium sp.]|nr:MAG: hypothetical protein EAZ92_02235 [Candidatus Kapabacteria bacterium]